MLSWSLSTAALATEPPPDGANGQAAARALFMEGRKLVASGDYVAACPKFEESLRLDPGIGTSFNLADCWEHLGRTASAWARFLDVAASSKAAAQPDRERVARDRAAALEPLLARLVVVVTTPLDGLAVVRDGLAVREVSWGLPVPVDPGVHTIEVTAPLKKKWSLTVTVPPAASVVSVSVPRLEDESPPPPAAMAPAAPPASAPTARADLFGAPGAPSVATRSFAPAVTAGGVALLGLATAAIFAFEFQSTNDQAKSICPTSMNCLSSEKSMHDTLVGDARRDRFVVYFGLSLGAVASLAAALLWPRSVVIMSPAGSTRSQVHLDASGLVWQW